MADSTIANLPDGSPAQSTDEFPIQRGASTLKLKVSDTNSELSTTVTLTAAQVNALQSGGSVNDVQVLPPPPAGTAYLFNWVLWEFVAGSSLPTGGIDVVLTLYYSLAFNGDPTNGNAGISLPGNVGDTVSSLVGFFGQGSGIYWGTNFAQNAPLITDCVNSPIKVGNTGVGVTSGGSGWSVKLKMFYRIVALP